MSQKKTKAYHAEVIYDVLYGFIRLTEWEARIVNSPFFQRLRWIKQLGFSNYIFPGAEHSRFAHVIGVMHSMEQMLRALGLAVPESELFDPRRRSPAALLHRSLRIAALLHDIGTFPFSHAIEHSYIRHGTHHRPRPKGRGARTPKDLPNSHEHLGSFIIKNTDYEGGITRVLNDFGLDTGLISKIIKGDSPDFIANQLMHSDLDADRMDYLIRDAHYTGIKYGQFDRDYILANLTTYPVGKGQRGFGVRENATHAVEDFLIARFGWYSQIIRNPDSAKFDIIASHIAQHLLEIDAIHQFQDLLEMVATGDERFFWWNDTYFITRCQEVRYRQRIKSPAVSELIEMLLFRRPPKTIQHPVFAHRLMQMKTEAEARRRWLAEIKDVIGHFNRTLAKHGTGQEWILDDVQHNQVGFSSRLPTESAPGTQAWGRDPIKVVDKQGKARLLVQSENSLMKYLYGVENFFPSVYANDAAITLLKKRRLI
ncbi:MAG: HD domain-containing protein [Bacteriovoracia bacterium]